MHHREEPELRACSVTGWRSQIERVFTQAASLRPREQRCPDCARPYPSVPAILMLDEGGLWRHPAEREAEANGTWKRPSRCERCGATPHDSIPCDPDSGIPERHPSLILLNGPGKPRLNFEQWWRETYGDPVKMWLRQWGWSEPAADPPTNAQTS